MMEARPSESTRSKCKKPDKWGVIYSQANKDYQKLLERAAQLERENSVLRDKERLLQEVDDVLQMLVAGAAVVQQPPGTASAAQQPATAVNPLRQGLHTSQEQEVVWSAVMSAVQQQELGIRALCHGIMGSRYPACQQQSHGFKLFSAVCSKDILHKVSTLSAKQLTARLAHLQAKIALGVVQAGRLTRDTADTPILPAQLQEHLTEFIALVMAAMLWDVEVFRGIANTNMETQQAMEEPLPASHWLNVFQQLQLSQQQLSCLSGAHEAFMAGKAQLAASMQRHAARQAHTDALAAMLQKTNLAGAACSRPASQGLPPPNPAAQPAAAAGGVCALLAATSSAEAAAGTPAVAAAGRSPEVSSGQGSVYGGPSVQQEPLEEAASAAVNQARTDTPECVSLEELLDEQSVLLHRVLLLGVRLGIVTSCTLTEYQQALFAAVSYPSIPRMDEVLCAYQQHQEQQQLAAPRVPL